MALTKNPTTLQKEHWTTALLGVFFFGIYFMHSAPGIVFGDSPELALASASLGIAHPPGYPLFSLLTHFFHNIVPLKEYARSCNIFSALLSAVNVMILYKILRTLTIKEFPAIISCALFGFSAIAFSQAGVGEVYSLNTFFFLLIMGSISAYEAVPDIRFLLTAAFLAGLGLGNHHTLIAVIAAGCVYWFIIKRRFAYIVPCLFLFLLGLSVYLYFPLRSLKNPALDWGNPETWNAFTDLIRRKQFGFGDPNFTISRIIDQSAHFFDFLNSQLYAAALIIAAAGTIAAFKKNRILTIVFVALFLINGILTLYILNPMNEEFVLVDQFMTPSIIIAVMLFAYALDLMTGKNRIVFGAVALIVVSTIILKFYLQRPALNRSENVYAQTIAADSLRIVPESSVIIGETDYSVFPLWYVQSIHRIRPDVAILDADFLMLPWFRDQHCKKVPMLKDVIPDISGHGQGMVKNKMDDSVLEGFKIDQSFKLAHNIREKHMAETFFTYDLAELTRYFKPDKTSSIHPYGPLYHLRGGDSAALNPPALNLSPFNQKITLPFDEAIYLKPYVPYLSREAEDMYLKLDLDSALVIVENIYLLSPDVNNAANLAMLLAETGKDLRRARTIIEKNIGPMMARQPKVALVQGIIEVKAGNYQKALAILVPLETQNPQWCQIKLYILEALLRAGDKQKGMEYYQSIMRQCDDIYKKRVNRLLKQ